MAAVATTNPTVDELEKKEEELFRTGPLSVLTTSVKSNSQVGSWQHRHTFVYLSVSNVSLCSRLVRTGSSCAATIVQILADPS